MIYIIWQVVSLQAEIGQLINDVRQLAAIMLTDRIGYTALMSKDEELAGRFEELIREGATLFNQSNNALYVDALSKYRQALDPDFNGSLAHRSRPRKLNRPLPSKNLKLMTKPSFMPIRTLATEWHWTATARLCEFDPMPGRSEGVSGK